MSRVDERTRRLQEQSTALVLKFSEDPKEDIANERRKATFPVEELLYHLNGGKEKIERRYKTVHSSTDTPYLTRLSAPYACMRDMKTLRGLCMPAKDQYNEAAISRSHETLLMSQVPLCKDLGTDPMG
jgi:hypothetical protein